MIDFHVYCILVGNAYYTLLVHNIYYKQSPSPTIYYYQETVILTYLVGTQIVYMSI